MHRYDDMGAVVNGDPWGRVATCSGRSQCSGYTHEAVHLEWTRWIPQGLEQPGITFSLCNILQQRSYAGLSHLLFPAVLNAADTLCLFTFHLKHVYFYAQKQLLHSACLSHRSSVCPSICPSHRWISQKWCKIWSPNLHHRLPGRL